MKQKKKRSFKTSRLFLGWRELINYFYVKRTFKKARDYDEEWDKHRLRLDWVGRAYTVVNIKQEDVGDQDLVKKSKVIELVKPINAYINTLGVSEVISMAVEQKSERSWLVVYYPLFNNFSLWYILKILILIGGLTVAGIVLI